MLVKSDWMPKEPIKSEESLTVYLLTVNYLRTGPKNFSRLYVAVPIADRIGWKGGKSFVDELYLWTLHKSYMIPGLLSSGLKICNPLWKDNCCSIDHLNSFW